MNRKILFSGLLMLFLVGCTNEDVGQQTSVETVEYDNLQQQINQLSAQLKDNETKIEELNTFVEVLNRSNQDELSQLHNRIYMLESLISHNPSIESKHGFINDIKFDGTNSTLEIQFAEMKQDDGAPNGFVIEEKEISSLTLDKNANFFILESTMIKNIASIEDFKNAVNEHQRFFKLYIVDSKVVMLTEQYIP
ncbi:hypothetical protein CD29_13650 [Ureibacillus manganicus DSM 26584]|uniref:Lipoprotein n=1 Tax=Ureibacillus manganicus DSM 26584 TaxID=1384049 RepID=A0A0A3HZ17_9BACL|nr:hypothetical protein CD29_13650 [Ureibacillus manganicus DSM 26584]